jgi:pimeloyl-ACP methyl ester carboxylesterase
VKYGTPRFVVLLAIVLVTAPLAGAAAAGSGDVVIQEGLAIRVPRSYQRSVLAVDPIEFATAAGTWKAPKEGDSVAFPGADAAKWEKVMAAADGWFASPALGDGYVFVRVPSEKGKAAVLNGLGDAYVYVNGEFRMGGKYAVKDKYESWEPRFDYGQVPVLLKKGDNGLLFRCTRGRLKVVLSEPPLRVFLNGSDVTLPDFVVGERVEAWGAVVIMNATDEVQRGLAISATGPGLEFTATDLGPFLPMSVRKVPFLMKGTAPVQAGKLPVTISLSGRDSGNAAPFASLVLELEAKDPRQNHKRTFLSGIDGSVQYYSVNPARSEEPGFKPAFVLSVHGAGVEATNQAGSYAGKSWANIVAATNRRPYGFDWEDWGRLDALEVMADFTRRYPWDPMRVYLTGHSMGGHGAWILGATFPDRFAAVGPSAGWISFRTYASRQKEEGTSEVEKLASRPLLQGDTLALVTNLANLGVYFIHGDKDESVPVAQSRQMAKTLAEFHKDFVYHEEKDAPHWWDKSDEPGTDCVDYAPLFDFFGRHALPPAGTVREVDFMTANPGVSAQCRWARIEAQGEALKPSRVTLRVDPGLKRFSGTTRNVSRLALDLSMLEKPEAVAVELDGQVLKAAPRGATLWLYRQGGTWADGGAPSASLKGPRRSGPFKDAFRNRMLFVYGTQGTAEENAWALQKARFDAELFQYQGNGSIEIQADRDFRPADDPDRNVILYGNAATNRAWKPLLGGGPVVVDRGFVKAGGTRLEGKDLACLFLRPRPGSDSACVAAVSGTGILGMRLTNTRPYLYAGYALPDLLVFDARVARGAGMGMKLAGFFGPDWSVESGEFAGEAAAPAPPTAKAADNKT